MIIFIMIILIWLININYVDVILKVESISKILVEKNYDFIVQHTTNKDLKQTIKQRYFFSFFACSIYILLNIDKINSLNYIVLIIIFIVVFKMQYFIQLNKYKVKLNQAVIDFPYFLNNLCILVLDYPVINALYKSIDNSPDIFKQDLLILVQDAHSGKRIGLQPYLDFADKFDQVDDIKRIMRTLYSISITCENKDVIITSLAKIASDKVKSARKMQFENMLGKQQLIPWINFLWIGMVIIMFITKMDLSGLA